MICFICQRTNVRVPVCRSICSGRYPFELNAAVDLISEDYYTTHRAKRQGEIRLKREKVSEKRAGGGKTNRVYIKKSKPLSVRT